MTHKEKNPIRGQGFPNTRLQKERMMDKEGSLMDCPYCGGNVVYVDSSEVYGRSYGMIYLCRPCNAYVGVHKGTDEPLGRLANAELRKAKIAAHAAFDPLWKGKIRREGVAKYKARGAGYKWLASKLGINANECHIGMFDVGQCKQVVEACKL